MSTRPTSAPPLAAGQPQPNRLKLVLAAGLQEIGAPQDKASRKVYDTVVEETMRACVVVTQVEKGPEFVEAWLRAQLADSMPPIDTVLADGITWGQILASPDGPNAMYFQMIAVKIYDLTSAVAAITASNSNATALKYVALEMGRYLCKHADVDRKLARTLADLVVAKFQASRAYVTPSSSALAHTVTKVLFPDFSKRRNFIYHLPMGLAAEILNISTPPPPPPPIVKGVPVGGFLSTTATGPELTAIGQLLDKMPKKPIHSEVATSELRLLMHEYVRPANLQKANHKDLAKELASVYWACLAFMQFQVTPIVSDSTPERGYLTSLTIQRNLDEIARHSLGDFRKGGAMFKYIKAARTEFKFDKRGESSLVAKIDKYVQDPRFFRRGAAIALDTLLKASGDARMVPYWVHTAAVDESNTYKLPGDALREAAVFTNPPKRPKTTTLDQDIKFVLDLLWEPFAMDAL